MVLRPVEPAREPIRAALRKVVAERRGVLDLLAKYDRGEPGSLRPPDQGVAPAGIVYFDVDDVIAAHAAVKVDRARENPRIFPGPVNLTCLSAPTSYARRCTR